MSKQDISTCYFSRPAQSLTLISTGIGGASSNPSTVSDAQLSANGLHLVFASQASNLVANDESGYFVDIFLARNLDSAAPSESIFADSLETLQERTRTAVPQDNREP